MKGDRPLQVCISGFEVNIPNSEAEGAIALPTVLKIDHRISFSNYTILVESY